MKKLLIIMLFLFFLLNLNGRDRLNKIDWAGEWHGVNSNQFTSSNLTISNVNDKSFDFYLVVTSGSHFGEIENTAYINIDEDTTASFDDNEGCKIIFEIINNETIILNFSNNCRYYAGAGVFFDSEYTKDPKVKKLNLVELHVLKNDKEDKAFKILTGKDYDLFTNTMQITAEIKDIDNLNARVIIGKLLGLYGYNEAIIMITKDNKICCAVIDGDIIKYYTNIKKYKNSLPKTIEKWQKAFHNKEIIYK
jgi:hypothetical protein